MPRLVLSVLGHRVLQIADDLVGAAVRRSVEVVGPVTGHQQPCGRAGINGRADHEATGRRWMSWRAMTWRWISLVLARPSPATRHRPGVPRCTRCSARSHRRHGRYQGRPASRIRRLALSAPSQPGLAGGHSHQATHAAPPSRTPGSDRPRTARAAYGPAQAHPPRASSSWQFTLWTHSQDLIQNQ